MSNTISSLRRKISVANDLRSVVRTMKSVAASNISQYENSVKALVEYNRSVEMGLSLCLRSPKREVKPEKKASVVGAIVFGSDQGLIGQLNEVIADYAVKRLKENSQQLSPNSSPKLKVWAVGERVHLHLENSGMQIGGVLNLPGSVASITPLVQELTNQILLEISSDNNNGEPAELYLFYNHPSSGSTYEPVDLQLLPLNERWLLKLTKIPWPTTNLPEILGQGVDYSDVANTSQTDTLRAFIREYIFVSIFRACAESLASENASRLSAMQRADKNIEDLLENLNGTFHRSRQGEIDEELFDVVASFEILNEAR